LFKKNLKTDEKNYTGTAAVQLFLRAKFIRATAHNKGGGNLGR